MLYSTSKPPGKDTRYEICSLNLYSLTPTVSLVALRRCRPGFQFLSRSHDLKYSPFFTLLEDHQDPLLTFLVKPSLKYLKNPS